MFNLLSYFRLFLDLDIMSRLCFIHSLNFIFILTFFHARIDAIRLRIYLLKVIYLRNWDIFLINILDVWLKSQNLIG